MRARTSTSIHGPSQQTFDKVGVGALDNHVDIRHAQFALGAVAPSCDQPPFMVAEQSQGMVLFGQFDYLAAVRSAVDEITQDNEPVFRFQFQQLEKIGKFLVAAMDVTNGDDTSVN